MIPLLTEIGSVNMVVTADALHAVAGLAEGVVTDCRAHYLLTVKGNQPKLKKLLSQLPWKDIPVAHREHDTGHGRVERRVLKVCEVAGGLGFPHAKQALRIDRSRRVRGATRWNTETVYAVTDLGPLEVRPAVLAFLVRGHWQIENAVHYVRDVTFGEDGSRIRTGSGPQVMVCLRNLSIALHRFGGAINIAAARRHAAWNTRDAVERLLSR